MSISTTARDADPIDHGKLSSALLAVIAIVTPLVSGGYALSTYLDKRGADRVNNQFEARKPYVTQQANLYLEATVLIGELVTRPRTEVAWQDNDRRFSVLLWSELPAYESDPVRNEMSIVSKKIENYRTAVQDADVEKSRKELQDAATVLSTIMGEDLRDNLILK